MKSFIVAPMTSVIGKIYPFEALVMVEGRPSKVMLDQVRTIDRVRLAGYLGTLKREELKLVENVLKLVLDIV